VDLLLTDVVMPDMKGPELACALLATHPDLRVLYASGYTDDALMESGTLEKGVDLIPKPFTRADLLGRVRAVLGKPAA
jgi:CheY-like chemotaxis protein